MSSRREPALVRVLDRPRHRQNRQGLFDPVRLAATDPPVEATRGLYVFKHDSELGNAHAHSLFDRISIKLPTAGDLEADQLLQRIVEIFHEEGELAADISGALKSDRRIDDEELVKIEKHLQQSMEKLVQLREEVRAKHALDKAGK